MRYLALLAFSAMMTIANAADHVAMNKTCPIDGKPIDTHVKMVDYNPKTDISAKASSGATAQQVGFCCQECCDAYSKDPAKYQDVIEKQRTTTTAPRGDQPKP